MLKPEAVIDSFTIASGFAFLSPWHPSSITIDGVSYPTVEHAMQAHKTLDAETRELVRRAKSPKDAKKLGHSVQVREDWPRVKLSLMREFNEKKFESPFLRDALLKTGDAELVFKNTWNDTYFGVCKGVGENWLGKILMEIREDIRRKDSVVYEPFKEM